MACVLSLPANLFVLNTLQSKRKIAVNQIYLCHIITPPFVLPVWSFSEKPPTLPAGNPTPTTLDVVFEVEPWTLLQLDLTSALLRFFLPRQTGWSEQEGHRFLRINIMVDTDLVLTLKSFRLGDQHTGRWIALNALAATRLWRKSQSDSWTNSSAHYRLTFTVSAFLKHNRVTTDLPIREVVSMDDAHLPVLSMLSKNNRTKNEHWPDELLSMFREQKDLFSKPNRKARSASEPRAEEQPNWQELAGEPCRLHQFSIGPHTMQSYLPEKHSIIAPREAVLNVCYGRCQMPLIADNNTTSHSLIHSLLKMGGKFPFLPDIPCVPVKYRSLTVLVHSDTAFVSRILTDFEATACACR